MMRYFLALAVGLSASVSAFAQNRPKEELVDQVKDAITNGVRYLKQQQRPGGDWERGAALNGMMGTEGGPSCLAMLALLNAGVPPTDPVIQLGLKYVRSLPPTGTYVVGLQTMIFAEIRDPRDMILIEQNVKWLQKSVVAQNGKFMGWSYGALNGGGDNSNTQYALLGLYAAKQAGFKISDQTWATIREYYARTQLKGPGIDGGWSYSPGLHDQSPRQTMTMAGLCGMYIAGDELTRGIQGLDEQTGVARNCGMNVENQVITDALRWLSQPGNFTFTPGQYLFYNMYGIERTGRLSGQRFLAGRDWYREGCELLVKEQLADGSWSKNAGLDGWTNVSTSFALLFMSKGRTPVLITKLAWGRRDEWNNKHHDMKHVVDFASTKVFHNVPLAWQVHDGRHMEPNQVLFEVGDLLQSPIVYLNGHEAPNLNGAQKEMLKRYIQEGGFVFAEACCGRKEFADGFRDLMKDLFDKEMTPVPADHALYRAFEPVDPNMFPMERLDLGCKTVVVLSTNPVSGWWEENERTKGKGLIAFRLAGNIVAYATGMEVPKPRLVHTKVEELKSDPKLPRGFLKVAQVRHEGDWQPAPGAMRNLMAHMREEAKLDLALTTDPVSITSPTMFNYNFFYMHGRRKFDFADADLKNLRAKLKTGGLLLSDACCGSKEFDAAFRAIANKLFPDAKLQPIPLNDELFGKELNGTEIKQVKVRLPKPGGGAAEPTLISPALEGIKLNNRWVVIYSKYDLGCALEKHPSGDCVGHDNESALRVAGAALLYYLKK